MIPTPRLRVTTSWDDGTTADMRLADLLERYGVKGTFYVSKVFEHSLPEADIVTLGSRFEIGAHTIDHPDLTRVPAAEAQRQIEESKLYLEALLGRSVPMFCYPFGRYNEPVEELVKRAGFIGARTCDPGGLGMPRDPHRCQITLLASNGSPLMALKIWWRSRLLKIAGLLDWESRAKHLFDLALAQGGVYHMYGHSGEFEEKHEWSKVERVIKYVAHRPGVTYATNGEIMSLVKTDRGGDEGAYGS